MLQFMHSGLSVLRHGAAVRHIWLLDSNLVSWGRIVQAGAVPQIWQRRGVTTEYSAYYFKQVSSNATYLFVLSYLEFQFNV